MLTSQQTISLFNQYVIANYTRYPVALVKGQGSEIWDAEGKRYIDFFPGWGCGLLGHCPKPIVEAVQKQAAQLIHVPNTWYTELQGTWAKLLSERSFGGLAFFCNSGTEANEAAIKLVRLYSGKDRCKIITFQGSFHGRTMGSLSATAQPKYHAGLAPMLAGFTYVPYGDLKAVESAADDETAAVMIEPIQGEGGVRMPPEGFLQGLRNICNDKKLLLVFDEVQTGCGRTGHWFAYQYFGVEPDIMTLAKAVAGSFAGAAMLAKKDVAGSLRPGTHAATFGGNPIAAAAGIAAIEMIEAEGLLEKTQKLGKLFVTKLQSLAEETDLIQEVRGTGAMIGAELAMDGTPFVQACMERGLLINCTHGNVLRLLPAMNLPENLANEGLEILADVLKKG
ncbi:MAG: aspartate aminotransferase family protein [Planctomycetaceae bacterium]|jgi:predicted acetylornithine/succinylornithine family transaminase|nr:aspartate aminotransferase family protein [Planctomycetaceae bacterium]